MSKAPEHTTSWEDGGVVMVYRCHGVELDHQQFPLDTEDPTAVCPRCNKRVTLVWDVRVVTEGDDEPQ